MHRKENLAQIKKMDQLAPEVMKSFSAFDEAAVAVALTTQCPYCIEIHTGNARRAARTTQN